MVARRTETASGDIGAVLEQLPIRFREPVIDLGAEFGPQLRGYVDDLDRWMHENGIHGVSPTEVMALIGLPVADWFRLRMTGVAQ